MKKFSGLMRHLIGGGLYSGAAYIQGRPIFKGGLYSGAAYIGGGDF